jgi:hypothetical protein
LQAVPLMDLAKFRIPEEFPAVPASAIRTEIALAIIRQESPWIWQQDLEIGRLPRQAFSRREGHVSIVIRQGDELNFSWSLPAHAAVRRELAGVRMGDLKLPTVVSFRGNTEFDKYDARGIWTDDYAGMFDDDTPHVIFTRQASGDITILEGNAGGFYQLHKYCHTTEHIPTRDEIYGRYPNQRSYDEARKVQGPYLQHYRNSAQCGAKALMRDYVDSYVLPATKS